MSISERISPLIGRLAIAWLFLSEAWTILHTWDGTVKGLDAFPKDDWPVVFVFAPIFADALPAPGSIAAARLQACKGRIAGLASQRRNTRYLDLMVDDPILRVVDNFFDEEHYGPAVARWVESRISGLIRDSGLGGLAP